MRRGTPRAHLCVERAQFRSGRRRALCAAREVRPVEVVALGGRGVARGVEGVRRAAVVVGRPLVEVVRDVERSGIRRRVFKVDDDDLAREASVSECVSG